MRERHPMLLAALASGALFLSACTSPADEEGADGTAGVVEEDLVEEDVVTGGDPEEEGTGHEDYQAVVDCLVEEGAAEEGYTSELFETDLYGGFQSGEADLEHPEFTECLALNDIELEFED